MVSSYIVEKYVGLCGFQLLKKEHDKWNFRCSICGDSKKNPNKKRGFILYNSSVYKNPHYKCYNCGAKMSFQNFLRDHKPFLYDDYRMEVNGDNLFKAPTSIKIEKPKKEYPNIVKKFQSIYDNEEVIDYLKKRMLPKAFVKELYYSDNYLKVLKDNGFDIKYEPKSDKRIVIPIYNDKNQLTHLQGRAVYKTDLRYITTTIKDVFKVWGLDRIDHMKPVYCFEGILDAVFIKNSVAPLGSNFDVEQLKKHVDIYVPDFDIHTNKDLRVNALKWVETGNKIFIPPPNIKGKDINDLVMQGWKYKEIMNLINSNIYQGVLADVKLKSIGRIK